MICLDDQLQGVRTLSIAGHVRPDGDAFGSCMGLYQFLKKYYPQIEATVYLEDNYSPSFRFLEDTDKIVSPAPPGEPADLFVSLDVSAPDRLGDCLGAFQTARRTLVIDHHISNPAFGQVNEIQPEASSTSEIVTRLIGWQRLTPEIAKPLYMGIVHDTGVFQYSCTSTTTMTVAGWLMDTGIDFSKIVSDTFFTKTYAQIHAIGKALGESMLMLDGKVIFSVMSKRDMDFYGVGPNDLGSIVSLLRETEGVEVAIFLYETGTSQYKVSLRSNGKVDVAAIASFFQGGGHVRAAGCTMNGGVHDVINNIVARVEEQLAPLGKETGSAKADGSADAEGEQEFSPQTGL